MQLHLFSTRALKVMQFARKEAERLNHENIGTEHILLGLLKEGSGVTPSMLNKIDHDFRSVRAELDKHLKGGSHRVNAGKLPFAPDTVNVLEYAAEEARNLEQQPVAAEHILLGLLREPNGIAAKVLLSFGVNVEQLRPEIEGILHEPYDE